MFKVDDFTFKLIFCLGTSIIMIILTALKVYHRYYSEKVLPKILKEKYGHVVMEHFKCFGYFEEDFRMYQTEGFIELLVPHSILRIFRIYQPEECITLIMSDRVFSITFSEDEGSFEIMSCIKLE